MDDLGSMSNPEVQQLIVEREAQNKAFRNSRIKLIRSLDHYSALYDSAPVGYLTLDRHGGISDANLMAASMFGIPFPFSLTQQVAAECVVLLRSSNQYPIVKTTS